MIGQKGSEMLLPVVVLKDTLKGCKKIQLNYMGRLSRSSLLSEGELMMGGT